MKDKKLERNVKVRWVKSPSVDDVSVSLAPSDDGGKYLTSRGKCPSW